MRNGYKTLNVLGLFLDWVAASCLALHWLDNTGPCLVFHRPWFFLQYQWSLLLPCKLGLWHWVFSSTLTDAVVACQSGMIGDLEGRIRQLTLEAESSGHVREQMEHGNTQMQMNIDELHVQLRHSETRFIDVFFPHHCYHDCTFVCFVHYDLYTLNKQVVKLI